MELVPQEQQEWGSKGWDRALLNGSALAGLSFAAALEAPAEQVSRFQERGPAAVYAVEYRAAGVAFREAEAGAGHLERQRKPEIRALESPVEPDEQEWKWIDGSDQMQASVPLRVQVADVAHSPRQGADARGEILVSIARVLLALGRARRALWALKQRTVRVWLARLTLEDGLLPANWARGAPRTSWVAAMAP